MTKFGFSYFNFRKNHLSNRLVLRISNGKWYIPVTDVNIYHYARTHIHFKNPSKNCCRTSSERPTFYRKKRGKKQLRKRIRNVIFDIAGALKIRSVEEMKKCVYPICLPECNQTEAKEVHEIYHLIFSLNISYMLLRMKSF